MINSVSQSAGVDYWHQPHSERTAPPTKPKQHEKEDTVQLSRQAQKAVEASHQQDKR